MNRKKKLVWNTGSSLLYQITAIICGFILPRLILSRYGSNVNGLVNSITQFLQVIAFLDLGVGAVIQSALYKPLADGDMQSVSQIVTSGQKFFRRIALILVVYIAVLTVVYPFGQLNSFDFAFTALLILAMSISLFAQYYFGVTGGESKALHTVEFREAAKSDQAFQSTMETAAAMSDVAFRYCADEAFRNSVHEAWKNELAHC